MDTIYTLEKHLLICGQLGEKYKRLYDIYNFNKTLICDVIDETDRYFSFYSCHDSTHSETIISSIELLLGENGIKQLSPTDTFLLLLSAYLHDFGMSLQYTEIKEVLVSEKFNEFVNEKNKEDEFKEYTYWLKDNNFNLQYFDKINWPLDALQCVNVLLSEFFRSGHADNSEKKVIERFKNSNININPHKYLPERLEELLARICSLHTKNFADVLKLDYECNGVFNDKVHPRFLSMLIRIGDLLDLDNNRFNEIKLASLCDELPQISKVHYNKHKSIKSFLITPQKINIVAESDDDNVLREMRKWVQWLKSELRDLSDNWNEIVPNNFCGTFPKLQDDLKRNNAEIFFADKDLKLSLPEKKAFQIIQGTNIYSHNLIFIREYIQNSLDALKLQFFLDQLQRLDDFESKEKFKNEDDKLQFINEEYYSGNLECYLSKYGINIRVFDCRVKEEIEMFKSFYNSRTYMQKKFENKIIIVVEDNGIGISVEDLNNKILCVGKKEKNNIEEYIKLVEKMPPALRPTGAFGIGLHSGFLVTDKIIMHTRTAYDKDKGREIIIESGTKNGFVECIIWDKEEEKRNTIIRGTQVIVTIDPDRIIVDEKPFTSWYKYKFPFGKTMKSHLIEYINNITQELINQPIFTINILDYENKYLGKISRNNINETHGGETIFKEKSIVNNRIYDIKILKDRNFKEQWHLDITDRERGNNLILTLSDIWDKDKDVTTLYKGIKLQSPELQKILNQYLLIGTKATINYNFKETSEYITINRDNVTIKGRELCEKIFTELMDIGISQLKTYLMYEYQEDSKIEDYIKARRIFEPIVEDLNMQFSKFLSKEKDDKTLDFQFEHNENWGENIKKLLQNTNVTISVEAFVKILSSKIWDYRDCYEEYNLQDKIYKFKGILSKSLSKFLKHYNANETIEEFLSTEYINCLFNILDAKIGGYALHLLGNNNFSRLKDQYESKDGKLKRVEFTFKENIPALAIFLYHVKYAQAEFLNGNYKNILEVMADNYIYDSNYGHYHDEFNNEFKNVFLYRLKDGNLKKIFFGAEAIFYYEQLYLLSNEFYDEKGNVISIYPVENLKVKYLEQRGEIDKSQCFVQLYNKKNKFNEHVFIKENIEILNEYLFSDIVEYYYMMEDLETSYFKRKDVYCMPAIDYYRYISVIKMPFEFERCYKESKFKYIKQDNYIMLPIDKSRIEKWGGLFENSYSSEFKKLVSECRAKLVRGDFYKEIDITFVNDNVYNWEAIDKYYTEKNIDIYKLFLNDCKEIKNSKFFLDIVNFTIRNMSYKSNETEKLIREKIIIDYLRLLRDVFVYIIDFFYKR